MKALAKACAAGALAIGAFAPACAADAHRERLDRAVEWLNQAQERSGTDAIWIQVLSMDQPSYKAYIASALTEDPQNIGSVALAAFYQGGAFMNGRRRDICFLLYNPAAQAQLVDQFVAPYERSHGAGMAPYLFLAAHELGHCLDFRARSRGAPKRQGVAMEALADVFAIKLLLAAGSGAEGARAIVESRQRSGPTHATWPWASRALQGPLSSPNAISIEDAWKKADEEVARP